MSTEAPDQAAPEESHRKSWVIVGVFSVALIVLIQDVVGWFGHGGVFSLVAAVHAASAGAMRIDVDPNALRSASIAIAIMAAVWLGASLNMSPDRRILSRVILLLAIPLGFALNGVCGKTIVSSLIVAHGYSRCPAHDHVAGHRKSRVWFQNYVRSPAICPPQSPAAPPKAPHQARP